MKLCTHCSTPKAIEDYKSYFCKNRNRRRVRSKCLDCERQIKKDYYAQHPEKLREIDRKCVAKRRESGLLKAHYDKRIGHFRAKSIAKRLRKREEYLEKSRNHYVANKHCYLERNARRRALVLQRTPSWLTKEQIGEMRMLYKQTPKGHHVDHIVPLQGVNVSGLHVPWNLQLIPAIDNLRKFNKHNPAFLPLSPKGHHSFR